MTQSPYEAVIGLEVHVQLATQSKLFCGCPARPLKGRSVAQEPVNGNVCPICAAHPGTLPVLNRKAVEYAIRAGLAMGCQIHTQSIFSRKNYFYPDLPKGYQISQYDRPICTDGSLEVQGRKISIQRIHLEEDAGKTIHTAGFSVVNLNRAGVPLIEIVSGPELYSSEEAGAYLRKLYGVVTYLGICAGDLQEGNFRCDANVSIRKRGSEKLGTRVEIKNINSFRFIEKAIEYEIDRQILELERGGRVVQETRLFDSNEGKTYSMRSKEQAEDYRYFPDPDLIPLVLDEAWVEKIRKSLPEVPDQKRKRYIQTYSLSEQDADALTSLRSISDFFEMAMQHTREGKWVANLILGEGMRLSREHEMEISESRLTPEKLVEIADLMRTSAVSNLGAKQLIQAVWNTGEEVSLLVEKMNLRQVSEPSVIEPIVEQVIINHPSQVEELRSGKEKVLGFLVGQVMKQSQGKANPQLVQELIRKKVNLK